MGLEKSEVDVLLLSGVSNSPACCERDPPSEDCLEWKAGEEVFGALRDRLSDLWISSTAA
jgi:hypothetical protein